MSLVRALIVSIVLWMIGALVFSIASMLPFIQEVPNGASWILAVLLIPLAIIGSRFYYHRGRKVHGVLLGLFMLSVSILMDALITVPMVILPSGGSYHSFFMDLGFWSVGMVYVGTVAFYYQFYWIKT